MADKPQPNPQTQLPGNRDVRGGHEAPTGRVQPPTKPPAKTPKKGNS